MNTDPFSDILKYTNAHSVVSGGFTTGGPWSLSFAPPDKIKFFAAVKGRFCLRIEDDQPIWVESGEVFMLAAARGFVLASDPDIVPMEAHPLFVTHGGAFIQLGTGDDCWVIGGHVQLDTPGAGLLADVLPPLIHVRATSRQASVLQWLVEQLVNERQAQLPGTEVVSGQLAQLMFVQLLRAYLADAGPMPPGWLQALADPRIAPALRLMHSDPGKPWQLEELAKSVAMSRTTFALRFRTVVGVPPLTYLLNWRMRIAERSLRDGTASLSNLALSLGYTSESAFSNAFKRTVGMAPKRYRDSVRGRDHLPPLSLS
jgi:AraC-like DNA-binding protein